MKIVADDKIPALKGVFEPYAKVNYLPGKEISKEDLKDADALIVRTRTKCNEALLKNSKVRLVTTATIGTDHMDLDWLNKAGIKWYNAPGCNSGSVRQYLASILANLIIEGMVPTKKTIGIVGVGMVGAKVAQIATALGFKVLLNDPPRQRKENSNIFCDLPYLLKNSDIITFHTPLNKDGQDASYHLFNKDSIPLLKTNAIIINSSRGEICQTQALIEGLKKGIIARIVLDVWENEPNIHPQLHKKVWLGTPHIAGYSVDGKANGTIKTVHAIAKEFSIPLTNWQPKSLPLPKKSTIKLTENQEPDYLIAAKAILKTYDIKQDDEKLRMNPGDFEKLRGEYPPRREFHIWTIIPHSNTNKKTIEMLKDIGFKIA